MGLPHTGTQRRPNVGVVIILSLAAIAAVASAALAGPGKQPPPAQHRAETRTQTLPGAEAWNPARGADDTDAPDADTSGTVEPEGDMAGLAPEPAAPAARPARPARRQAPPAPPAASVLASGAPQAGTEAYSEPEAAALIEEPADLAPPALAPEPVSLDPAAAELVARATSSLLRQPAAPAAPEAPAPVPAPAPAAPAPPAAVQAPPVQAPPVQAPVAPVAPAVPGGGSGDGVGPATAPVCPLAGQNCGPVADPFRCATWKAPSPGDGCPPPPAPALVNNPGCATPALPVAGAYKAQCVPGDPGQIECQTWVLQCDPAHIQIPEQPGQDGQGQAVPVQSTPSPGGSKIVIGGTLPSDFREVANNNGGGGGFGGGFGF